VDAFQEDRTSGSSDVAADFLLQLRRWASADASASGADLRAQLIEWLRAAQAAQPTMALVHQLAARDSAGPLRWIRASLGPSMKLIAVDDVVYFQAEDKYTRVVTADGEALIRKTIKELGAELDPEFFWQVHRATIVNLRSIARVDRDYRDQPLILLKGRPETLTVSRTFASLFKAM